MTAPSDLAHVSTAELREAVLTKGASILAVVALDELARRAEAGGRAVGFIRSVATNFDHDNDAHRYGTECRKCEAENLLDLAQPQTAAPPVEPDHLRDATKMVEPEALDAMTKERDALAKALQLMEHKVITCGVAAERGDLDGKKCYAETWNSPQAEKVRALRRERDELRAEIERAGATVDQLRPMLESALTDFRKMVFNWSGARKEGARWVEAWLVSQIDSLNEGGDRG
jgi:hypothetical protein